MSDVVNHFARLQEAVNELATIDTAGPGPWDHLTCREADLIADVLRAGGHPEVARQLIAIHAEADEVDDIHHKPLPDDLPDEGDRCKYCGEDITWEGPGMYDWIHVDDPDNQ